MALKAHLFGWTIIQKGLTNAVLKQIHQHVFVNCASAKAHEGDHWILMSGRLGWGVGGKWDTAQIP